MRTDDIESDRRTEITRATCSKCGCQFTSINRQHCIHCGSQDIMHHFLKYKAKGQLRVIPNGHVGQQHHII